MGPINGLVNAFPVLAKVNVTITEIYNLEQKLDEILSNHQDLVNINNIQPMGLNKYINFKNIVFSYRDDSDRTLFTVGPLDLKVNKGEMIFIIGGNGSGKSTLLKEIVLLQRPRSGSIRIFDQEIWQLGERDSRNLRRRFGMMFQHGALFGGLTVAENIMMPLLEHTRLASQLIMELAALKIALVGLPAIAGTKYPSQLSGGMIKRAAIARALALDPDILFLDEPTAGLDPQGAAALDDLVLQLRELLGLTVVMVTHDLDTLWRVTDRVAVLGERRVLAHDTINNLAQLEHPLIRNYFIGPRARNNT